METKRRQSSEPVTSTVLIALMAVGAIGPYIAIAQAFRGQVAGYNEVFATIFFALGFAWFSVKIHEKAVSLLDRLDE